MVLEGTMIGTVIAPLDGPQRAEQAWPFANMIAERLSVPLVVVRVIPETSAGADEEARSYLQQVQTGLADSAEVSLRTGNPVEQIIATAD
jgi:hypothetical protein